MVLQPLLENAVYHGVEPGTGVGDVLVRIERRGDRVHATIENPHLETGGQRSGNRKGLENIRERPGPFFDAQAGRQTPNGNWGHPRGKRGPYPPHKSASSSPPRE